MSDSGRRDAKALQIVEETSEIQRQIVTIYPRRGADKTPG
jgi:hypothetical protein